MAHLSIQCQNCGAKYKIPETFKSDSAKCKACGSTIDVAAQRNAAPAEKAEEPTRPAATRSASRGKDNGDGGKRRAGGDGGRSSGRKSSRRRRGDEEEVAEEKPRRSRAAGGRRGRRGGGEDDGDDDGGHRRRERKKDNTPMIVGGVIGGLAIVTLALVWNYWGDITGKVKIPGQGEKFAKAQKKKEEEAAQKRKEHGEAQKKAQEEANRKAKEAADKKKAAGKKAKEAAAKKPKKANELKSKADIFNPKKDLQPAPLPKELDEAKAKEVDELLADVLNGGLPGIKAKTKLTGMSWLILVPTANKMRELDFTTVKGNRHGFELDRLIKTVTEWESGFDPAIYEGEEFPLKTAHANAKVVKDYNYFARKRWQSQADFEKWMKSRNK